jgi:hypothetical protein
VSPGQPAVSHQPHAPDGQHHSPPPLRPPLARPEDPRPRDVGSDGPARPHRHRDRPGSEENVCLPRHPRARPGDPNQHRAAIDPRVEPEADVQSQKPSPHLAYPGARPSHDGDRQPGADGNRQPSHPRDRQAPQTVRSPPDAGREAPA